MKAQRSPLKAFQRGAALYTAGVVALVVAAMPYHAFLSTWAGYLFGAPLVWKSWKELLLGTAILVLAVTAPRFRSAWRLVWAQSVTKLIALYAALHLLVALVMRPPLAPTLAGLMMNLRFLVIFLVAQLLLAIFPQGSVRPRRWLVRLTLISSVVIALLGLLQVTVIPRDFLVAFGYDKTTSIAPYITVDQNPAALRAFATMRGPNTLGMFLIIPICMFVVLAVRRWRLGLTVPALALCLITLVLTGSRSAWIGLVVGLIATGLALSGRSRMTRLLRRYGWIPAVAIFGLLLAATTVPALRLAVFHSSPGDPTLTEGSTDVHFAMTKAGALDALQHPFGRGPGQSGPASFYNPASSGGARVPENYYVQLAQEVGAAGLVLFVAISLAIARRLWRVVRLQRPSVLAIGLFASFWGIAVVNFMLHGWADDPTALVWWGLAGLTLPLTAIRKERHEQHD